MDGYVKKVEERKKKPTKEIIEEEEEEEKPDQKENATPKVREEKIKIKNKDK
jgi:hypothetical protein